MKKGLQTKNRNYDCVHGLTEIQHLDICEFLDRKIAGKGYER